MSKFPYLPFSRSIASVEFGLIFFSNARKFANFFYLQCTQYSSDSSQLIEKSNKTDLCAYWTIQIQSSNYENLLLQLSWTFLVGNFNPLIHFTRSLSGFRLITRNCPCSSISLCYTHSDLYLCAFCHFDHGLCDSRHIFCRDSNTFFVLTMAAI